VSWSDRIAAAQQRMDTAIQNSVVTTLSEQAIRRLILSAAGFTESQLGSASNTPPASHREPGRAGERDDDSTLRPSVSPTLRDDLFDGIESF
jgi:hypothetical protein